MAGFGDTVTVPVKVEIVGTVGVLAERLGAWTTARDLLAGTFRNCIPADVLTLAAFLTGLDIETPAEPSEEADISDLETELAADEEPAHTQAQ